MRWKKKVARALESWSGAGEDGEARLLAPQLPVRVIATPSAIDGAPPRALNGDHAPEPATLPAPAAADLASIERRLAELLREQQSRHSVNDGAGEARIARLEARVGEVLREVSSSTAREVAARLPELGSRLQEAERAAAERLAAIGDGHQAKLDLLRGELARLLGEFASERARIATQLSEAAHEQRRHEQRIGALSVELSTLQDRLAFHTTDVDRIRRLAERARHLALIALVLAAGAFVVAAVRALGSSWF
jgi:hypothetical protein